MKQKLLLTIMAFAFFAYGYAQKNAKKNTAYAITAKEKGSSNWTEVKLVDLNTGEALENIYQSSDELPVLNARTGKPIEKKDAAATRAKELVIYQTDKKDIESDKPAMKNNVIIISMTDKDGKTTVREIRRDGNTNVNTDVRTNVTTIVNTNVNRNVTIYRTCGVGSKVQTDKPFATTSAACAYDKKHERIYYTPIGINQLRYVDLKGKDTKIYYFEDEPFGVVSGRGDVRNQITRMVIASDGNGYALNNQADHLIRFTTNKKSEITDLGGLSDDAANGAYSVHSGAGFGGDMIADKKGALYLITANRQIFKINVETLVATYVGAIKGLPRGFSTNAAVVDEDNNVIVASANSTDGYFKFSMDELLAEKVSTADRVFNASDLANGNLLAVKKKKKEDKKPEEEVKPVAEEQSAVSKVSPLAVQAEQYRIAVFPNPVTEGNVKVSFADYPAGKYEIQLIDVSGKVISAKSVNIMAKNQVQDFALPKLIAKGTYLVKVVGEQSRVLTVEQLVVQ